MSKKWVFLIVLLLIPVVFAEGESVSYDRFQLLMVGHQSQISQIIDDKYLEYEQFSNDAVTDVKKQMDIYVNTIVRKLVIGLLASYVFGATIILLFVNWYLRKFYRSKWGE